MPRQVIETSEIEQLEKDLLPSVELILQEESREKEIVSRQLDPFAKIFLQLKKEYLANSNTFTSVPNDNFLAFLVVQVLCSKKEPSEELLLQLAPFVSSSPLSDFFYFEQNDLDDLEAKALFLRQHVFSEMLEDFDHDITVHKIEETEELKGDPSPLASGEEVVRVVPKTTDLPDDILEEDLPELRQGLVKVKRP